MRSAHLRSARIVEIILAVCLFVGALSVLADKPQSILPDPGFRPDSEYSTGFLKTLDAATVVVYPTLVRRLDRTAHSFASQGQIMSSLNEMTTAKVVAGHRRIDLGPLVGASQWDVFSNNLQRIATGLEGQKIDADYHVVMEFLLPTGNDAIFGIECYVLDQQGRNAFSFLLNSHHRSFVAASLVARGNSEEARASLTERATSVGMAALKTQIEQARKRADREADSGKIDDFGTTLQGEADGNQAFQPNVAAGSR